MPRLPSCSGLYSWRLPFQDERCQTWCDGSTSARPLKCSKPSKPTVPSIPQGHCVRASNDDERQRSAVYTTAGDRRRALLRPCRGCVGCCCGPFWRGYRPTRPSRRCQHPLSVCSGTRRRRLRPLFATLVTQVIEAAYERAESQGRPLDPRLLVVLDEAANVAPIAELDVLASTAAGHGVQLVTIWQDLGQLSARYGSRAGSVVNNYRAKVFLSGIADPQTLERTRAAWSAKPSTRRSPPRSTARSGRVDHAVACGEETPARRTRSAEYPRAERSSSRVTSLRCGCRCARGSPTGSCTPARRSRLSLCRRPRRSWPSQAWHR